jgi:hypothetical protein
MKTICRKSILMLALLCSTFDVCAQTAAVEASNPNDVCAETWAKYQQANTLWKTGWGLFGVGLAAGAAGWTTFPMVSFTPGPHQSEEQKAARRGALAATLTVATVGSAMLISSVPCLIVGQVRRKSALRKLNQQCPNYQPSITFSVQSSQNGLGLAMQF